ncbi:FtsX-like permease family protein [Enterococcus sp. CSURQ0835]|uniref:FtsX-like permease family protein n=1 Tax=Enterococcus sp. CSURQ0835 TaxID=2681394 RepID=UPI00135B3AF8|nr:ABC transporter permease [Enterococcus sp. CSURQ0835]
MLMKLALTGIKSRLKDYVVLFSGLVMAAAIFYMFEALASNPEFLQANSMISSVVFVFRFGTVLLSIITLVYILYANSFLLTMRQKDYAMFMMLGAKVKKIAQLIFLETFVVGIVATLVGSVVGIGLTVGVEKLLVSRLDLAITKFSAFNLHGWLFTLSFFVILFLIAAALNARAIRKKPILELLHASQTPTRMQRKNSRLAIEALGGVICLAIGYTMLKMIATFQLLGIGVALVTIVLGSYLMFHSVIIFCLQQLKKKDRIALRQLNNFTLSQLSFRIRDYTQMLALVSLLFALALGALTVGLSFKNEISEMTTNVSAYDLVLNNAQEVAPRKIAALHPTKTVSYEQKVKGDTLYYVKEQFDQTPLQAREFVSQQTFTTKKYDGSKLVTDLAAQDQLRSLELPSQKEKTLQFVSRAEFNQVAAPVTKLQVVQVNDFMATLPQLKKLAADNERRNPELKQVDGSFSQKVTAYATYNALFSGFEFMGFFLGLAFLTMLASCLMFKILSGAASDLRRYQMLEKIGTRRSLLKKSIRQELGVLFLAPGILGLVHVLFGLQMFSFLLGDPYQKIWLPIVIFIVLYGVYYGLTVLLYTNLVMGKNDLQSVN